MMMIHRAKIVSHIFGNDDVKSFYENSLTIDRNEY